MDNKICEKLSEILEDGEGFVKEEPGISPEELENIEKKYKITIPEVYKEFILNNKCRYIKDDYYFPMRERSVFLPENGYDFIDWFIDGESFDEELESFYYNWPDDVIPIGMSGGGGDYVCIGCKGDKFGKIYMLYHEDEEREDGLYLAADSFEEFILSFRYIN